MNTTEQYTALFRARAIVTVMKDRLESSHGDAEGSCLLDDAEDLITDVINGLDLSEDPA